MIIDLKILNKMFTSIVQKHIKITNHVQFYFRNTHLNTRKSLIVIYTIGKSKELLKKLNIYP